MITPSIHMNGTSRDELVQQVCSAAEAVQNAMDALSKACPNGRDYYPQGDRAIGKALSEHRDRMARLKSVHDELSEIGATIAFTSELLV